MRTRDREHRCIGRRLDKRDSNAGNLKVRCAMRRARVVLHGLRRHIPVAAAFHLCRFGLHAALHRAGRKCDHALGKRDQADEATGNAAEQAAIHRRHCT
jgi:hypothetical protein